MRQATATFSRRRATSSIVEGAPYKPQDLVSNRYLVKDIVGAGPLGFVFRAHDKEIDVEVALKVINPRLVQTPDERKAFAKQMRQARKLSHPNLVRVYEEGEDQDRPYYTSQFLDGLTLRKIIDLRLQKGQFFNLREVEPILVQIGAALEGAHKVGPHSDVKPENVLVLPDLLKVTDFGLGLAMPRLPFVQAEKARKGDRYLSPELAEGREVDHRTDIYSMGVILGEMLAGLTPDGSMPELARRNPEVPPAVEGLYRKALNENPLARHKSAAEFVSEFQEISKRVMPPPLKSKPEPASGTLPRPRTATGVALQLSPRQTKPPPPVPEMPPPPPPQTGENDVPPDATQPVDPEHLASALAKLKGNGNGANGHANPGDRQETEVIQSGQFIGPDADETANAVEIAKPLGEPTNDVQVSPADSGDEPPNRTMLYLVILAVAGVGIGLVGGSILLKRLQANQGDKGDKNGLQVRAGQAEADRKAAEEKAKLEAQRLAEQKALDDKLAADKAEADRVAAEKAAAEKAEADKKTPAQLAAEKAAADKAAAAEKAAADKAAAAEKAEKDKADRDAAKKAAADKAAQDKADRDAAKKAAEEKAIADKKAAEEKKAAEIAEKKNSGTHVGGSDTAPGKGQVVASVATEKTDAKVGANGCPEGMRSIAAGTFKMGTAKDDPMMGFDEKALSTVDVKAYCIDTFEYPNRAGVAPVVNVAFADAKRMCESKSKRLCTEDEWEKACKGQNNARWPYGNAFDANACNTEDEAGDDRNLAGAGRFSKCRSGYGVADMSGNASEWTADKVIKGGSFGRADFAVRCSARQNGGARSSETGFRCCADPK
ncbi:MAG: bifunctional serine/threonine-protein kinase/formylglycine-generating enzyme family protein [Myxococcaceae bacterium]